MTTHRTYPEVIYTIRQAIVTEDGPGEKEVHATALPYDAVSKLAKFEALHPGAKFEIVPVVNGRVA